MKFAELPEAAMEWSRQGPLDAENPASVWNRRSQKSAMDALPVPLPHACMA